MVKVVILGSTGMLGNAVSKVFLGTQFEVYMSYRNPVGQITEQNHFYFDPLVSESYKNIPDCDYIINCIGIIKPFMASNIVDSIYINSIFPHELAEFCESKNIKLIHITTDCVYSGYAGNYNELSPHDALDDYGKSKSLGETKNAMVIRTSIIGEEIHKNASLIAWVKSMKNKDANGFLNHSWNGITTTQYGKICKTIIEQNLYSKNLFHCFSPRSVSKYELLQLINKHWNLNINVNPTNDKVSIDRTLSSIKNFNCLLRIPDLDEQLKEIAP